MSRSRLPFRWWLRSRLLFRLLLRSRLLFRLWSRPRFRSSLQRCPSLWYPRPLFLPAPALSLQNRRLPLRQTRPTRRRQPDTAEEYKAPAPQGRVLVRGRQGFLSQRQAPCPLVCHSLFPVSAPVPPAPPKPPPRLGCHPAIPATALHCSRSSRTKP